MRSIVVRQSEAHQLERTATAAEVALPATARLRQMPPLVRALRPMQWTKNALVFAALIFTHQALKLEPLLTSIAAAVIFCAVSSGIYLINDLRDIEHDK